MRRTAVSTAIEQLRIESARSIHRLIVAAVDVQADRLEVGVGAVSWSQAHPPIGSSGPRGRGGNSTPDLSLVAGFSNCLTLDAQREKAGKSHYGNPTDADALRRQARELGESRAAVTLHVGDVATTATPAPIGCAWPVCGCYSPQGPQACRRSEARA